MDWQLIQPIFHWLSEHPFWSGLFVFLIALTESLVIVGLVVPGTVLMFGVGTLVGTGVLDVKLVLFLAFLGAVLGDGISFWFGATYREQISGFWPFKNNPKILEKGKVFFSRHGGKSIFFGRFVGPVRPVIPAIAGMMQMPAKTFFSINIISAACWAPFYLIPGILFGSSIGLASAIGSRLVIVLLTVFVGAVLLVYLVKKSMAFAMPKLEGWFSAAIQWSSRHAFLGKFVVSLIDPRKNTKSVLSSAIIIFILLVLFWTTLTLGLWSPWLLQVDTVVKGLFGLLRSTPADEIMWGVQQSFSWLVLLLAIINILLGLYYSGLNKALNYFSSLLVVTALSSIFVVFAYGFSKIEAVDLSSFLHFSILISCVLFYAVISSESQPAHKRWPYYVVAVLVVFCFGFSNVYFSLLWFSQIFVAISLSVVWVLIFSLAYRRHDHVVQRTVLMTYSTLFIVVFAAALLIANNTNRELMKSSRLALHTVSTSEWLDNKWDSLAKTRADVFGKKKNHLNLQWQGSLADIKQSLIEAGWEPSEKTTFRSLLYWLAPDPDLNDVIRLPQTNDGKTESALFIKTEGNRQIVLQLWPSVIVSDNGVPVWLGAISEQRLVSGERWLSFFRVENSEIAALADDEIIASRWKILVRKKDSEPSIMEAANILLLYK